MNRFKIGKNSVVEENLEILSDQQEIMQKDILEILENPKYKII